jgi:leucyl aminopeptidase
VCLARECVPQRATTRKQAVQPPLSQLTSCVAVGCTQIAIVGKGLTFDSGGYNLKAGPGSMIELMKVGAGVAVAACVGWGAHS